MCIILFGYTAAVATATITTLVFSPALLFSPVMIVAMVITCVTAAPAMLCFAAFSEIRYRIGREGHILAGTLTASLALLTFGIFSEPLITNMWDQVRFASLGGAIGGWTYWRVAVWPWEGAASVNG